MLSSIPDNLSYRVIRDLSLDTKDTETINNFKAVISAIRKEINYRINRSRILRKDKEKDIVKLVQSSSTSRTTRPRIILENKIEPSNYRSDIEELTA